MSAFLPIAEARGIQPTKLMRKNLRSEYGEKGMLRECDSCKKHCGQEEDHASPFIDPRLMIGQEGPRPNGVCRAWWIYRKEGVERP